MKLKDLVGKMAIRTQKAREFVPWETDRAIRLDFMVSVPIFDDREVYGRTGKNCGSGRKPGCY